MTTKASRSIGSEAGRGSWRRPGRTALVVGLVFGALLLAPSVALAKKKVAVLDFTGSRASRFKADVTDVVRKKHSIITHRRYVAVAKQLDADDPTDDNVARVCTRLKANGVLVGSVERRGGSYTVKVILREGRTGEVVKTVTIKTKRSRLSAADKRKLRNELLPAIDKLPKPLSAAEARRMARAKAKEREKEAQASRKRRSKARRDREEVVEDDDEEDEEEVTEVAARDADEPEEEDEEPRTRVAARDEEEPAAEVTASAGAAVSDERRADLLVRGRGLELSGGASFVSRRLTFTYEQGLANAPQGYDGAAVAAGVVNGELYPLAFNLSNQGITRNLGVTGTYDQVLKIESRLRYLDGMNVEQEAILPTEQVRWGVGAVYRHNFGTSPTDPTVKLSVRYNRMRFFIDKSQAPAGIEVDIPNVDYTYIDPGIAVRYPLSAKLAARADARFILVTAVGEMQQEDQYGAAKITGLDGDLALEYLVSDRLFLRGGARYMRIGFEFDGNGELTNMRDADVAQDVFGALDAYLGGYLTAGYLF